MSVSQPEILIDLSTAILRRHGDELQCRLVMDDDRPDMPRLPFGPFMPDRHRTMEIGLRQWVGEQVGVEPAHVEQLYTFADQGRHAADAAHVVSVGYLALSRSGTDDAEDWRDIYGFFPWEDWRDGRPALLDEQILPALDARFAEDRLLAERGRIAFGRDTAQWDEEFVLERYELLYQAGLVEEAVQDGRLADSGMTPPLGRPLQLDHRRILATALGRLRGKLKYRPVIFDLMPPSFTLSALQATTEMVLGVRLHKQNFRRLVEKSGFLDATGRTEKARGRPAELFRFRHQDGEGRPLSGLRVSTGGSRRRG